MASLREIKRKARYIIRVMRGTEVSLRRDTSLPVETHGSDYGGWPILQNSLGSDSVVLSVGVGEDVSFDLALIEKYGCKVHGIDPTPKAVAWVAEHADNENFVFHQCALSGHDGTIRLYPPRNPDHVSASCRPNDHTVDDFFEVEAYTLRTLIKRLGIDKIDVLKMDIEGSEYNVINDLCADPETLEKVGQLMIEFHHYYSDFNTTMTSDAISKLREAGFSLNWFSSTGHEMMFLSAQQLKSAK